ncbi:MAG TPA: sigma-70 family RNA polymerase sigma factor [Fimbriiglobus sp.]|jgi:RNA polymerase sigma factor (sigma-70 family)|nr:sigma-70 family RNA polymerase sigma factor [Fimbriiglobus sp.]
MASAALLRHVADSAPDADLLRRFVCDRDATAFAELVRRHGPVVYRVCRRLLGPSLADDAFQATFLILATRPESVRQAGSVGSWLVGVAGRVARQMRKRERRFLASRERQRPEDATPVANASGSPEWTERFRILDEELTRLPDRLRGPVVVCLLQGRTQEQAVAELGGSVRTIRRRLEEAKQLLRLRLERRGVVPAVAAGLAAGVGEATASVPAELPGRTVSTVFDFLAGGAAVSAPVAVIAKGVAMGTLARKVKLAMVSAAVGLTALGVGLAGDEKPVAGPVQPPVAAVATPPLSVPTADGPAADPPPGPSERFATENFVVDAPTKELAQKFGESAERYRKEKAIEWLGSEMPRWPQKCPLRVQITLKETGGATTFTFGRINDKPEVMSQEMHIFGEARQLLTSTLPHEVTHTVLAHHFGQAVPRWADEGASVMSESEGERRAHDEKCREIMNQGRGISLRVLFNLKEYPRDMHVLFVQGYSVSRFLIEKKGKAKFLQFVREGMKDDNQNWDAAARLYGFDSTDELQVAWVDWLRKPLPAPAAPRLPAPPLGKAAGGFSSSAPSVAVMRAVLNEVTAQRQLMAERWVGAQLPSVPKRTIHIEYTSGGQTFSYANTDGGGDGERHPNLIRLGGDLQKVLESEIPAVLVKVVLVEQFGREVPPWATRGFGMTESWLADQRAADARLRKLASDGKAVRLSAFFRSNDARHEDDAAQAHSIARFLLARPAVDGATVRLRPRTEGEPAVVLTLRDVPADRRPHLAATEFVRVGMLDGWDAAAKGVYGFSDVDALEAAWINWLKGPVSRLPGEQPAPNESESPRIPPVKLPEGQPDRVGRIDIIGNTTVADKVILDQLGLVPGEAIHYPQLGKGRDNLIRLGVFASPPTIDQTPRHDGSGLIDFRVRVKELRKE